MTDIINIPLSVTKTPVVDYVLINNTHVYFKRKLYNLVLVFHVYVFLTIK